MPGSKTKTSKGLRSASGCLSCRRRRKKCDEIRPVCSACRRNFIDCTWPHAKGEIAGERVSPTEASAARKTPSVSFISFSATFEQSSCPSPSTGDSFHNVDQRRYAIPERPLDKEDGRHLFRYFAGTEGQSPTLATPERGASVLPSPYSPDLGTILRRLENSTTPLPLLHPSCLLLINESKTSTFLFDHYLDRTARAMSVIKDPSNPLICQIIPLALRSQLVMKAVLMISAIHISGSRPGWSALAWRYYGQVSDAFEERMKFFGQDQNAPSTSASDLEEKLVVSLLLAMFQVSQVSLLHPMRRPDPS